MKNKLAVAESFYSIQGEGQTMGTPAYFLRLAGCNLMCGGYGTEKDKQLHNGATWRCDSIEVWLKGKSITFEEVLARLGGNIFLKNIEQGAHLVITGGEPLLQQQQIYNFLMWLEETHDCTPCVEIETNGAVIVEDFMLAMVTFWNVSPKLRNSGMPIELRRNLAAIDSIKKMRTHDANIMWKFVVKSQADFDEAVQFFIDPLGLDYSEVWLMPAADNRYDLEEVSKYVAGICIDNNLHFSSRLHITIWNQKTGV